MTIKIANGYNLDMEMSCIKDCIDRQREYKKENYNKVEIEKLFETLNLVINDQQKKNCEK